MNLLYFLSLYFTMTDYVRVLLSRLRIATKNGTFVGEGISFLTPVKEEWVIGVAKAKIPLVGYVRLLPNIIFDEIKSW